MTLKSLKTLLAAGLVCGLFSAPALAEDAEVSSDNKYDLAYNKCSDVAKKAMRAGTMYLITACVRKVSNLKLKLKKSSSNFTLYSYKI